MCFLPITIILVDIFYMIISTLHLLELKILKAVSSDRGSTDDLEIAWQQSFISALRTSTGKKWKKDNNKK